MDEILLDRARGCMVGAAIGDALGMPLEFGPRQPAEHLVREMRPGRIPAGMFTDDTEMALAVAESLVAHCPLDAQDLAQRFARWYRAGPDDVGNHTRAVLTRIASGRPWQEATASVQAAQPDSAGNGSVMRCWPVAIAHWDNLAQLLEDSRLQSQITHAHPECMEGSALVNGAIYYLLRGILPAEAMARATAQVELGNALRDVLKAAVRRDRTELENSGWVRHTLESVVWSLRNTDSFEEAVVQVVNLGNDADTAGAVIGALAGAAYGLASIPTRWRSALRGEWPLGSGQQWSAERLIALADRLVAVGGDD